VKGRFMTETWTEQEWVWAWPIWNSHFETVYHSADNWAMVSYVKEHHKDYLTGWKQEGNHSDLMYELPEWCPTEKRWITKTQPETKGHTLIPQTELSKDQLVAATLSSTDKEGFIQLTSYLVNDAALFTILEYQQLDNSNYCERLYNVKFINPFKMTVPDIELPTVNLPSSFELMTDPEIADAEVNKKVVISELSGEKVFETADAITAAIEAEIAEAMLSYGDLNFHDWTFELVFDKEGKDTEASFGGHLTLDENGVFVWNNAGTQLQQDKVAHYKVSVLVDCGNNKICQLTATGKVTCLKSVTE